MTWSIRFSSTLLLVSAILSCNKHKDANANANKVHLSKLVQWNSASPSKNIVTFEFTYDDQKRLTEFATFNGDSADGEIKSAKVRSLKFFYNGADKNPFKTIGPMFYNSSPATETFYSYNASGALTRDSVSAAVTYYGSVRNYTYTSDKIIVQSTNSLYGSKDSFMVADHNLVGAFLNMSPTAIQAFGYKPVYDNKINPLSKLNIAALMTETSPLGFPSYLAPGYCKNNITEYASGSSTAPGNFTTSNTYYYTYTYNENNLPAECRYYNNNGNTIVKYYYVD